MQNLRLFGNIFDLQILFGEWSGTFRDSAPWVTYLQFETDNMDSRDINASSNLLEKMQTKIMLD